MAPTSKLKVRFLVPTKFGFKEDTPGHEARNLGDEYVYTVKEFAADEEYEFPAAESDAVKALVRDGLAVPVSSKADSKPEATEETADK